MRTNRPVTIYISAASELTAERDALARMIAELPVTLAWRILQTPAGSEPLDLEALAMADVYILVMGTDIRAPVGLEWDTARRTRRLSWVFLKRDIPRTPAGQVFINTVDHAWRSFSDAADLSQQVQRMLAEHFLQHAIRYALTPVEVEQLQSLRAEEEAVEQSAEPAAGADHSAVVLSRERFVPTEGTVITERPRCRH